VETFSGVAERGVEGLTVAGGKAISEIARL
jgi:hypothetical protein